MRIRPKGTRLKHQAPLPLRANRTIVKRTPYAILGGHLGLMWGGKPRADAGSGGTVLLLAGQHYDESRNVHDKG